MIVFLSCSDEVVKASTIYVLSCCLAFTKSQNELYSNESNSAVNVCVLATSCIEEEAV